MRSERRDERQIELGAEVRVEDGRIGVVSAANDERLEKYRFGATRNVCVGLDKVGGGVEQRWFPANEVVVEYSIGAK